MASFNRVTLLGNLGANVELRSTAKGQPVANFSVATNETWTDDAGKKQERTEWHRIVVFGTQGETCAKYLGKGSSVLVEGRLQSREWLDKDSQARLQWEVVANTVQFLSSKRKDAPADADDSASDAQASA